MAIETRLPLATANRPARAARPNRTTPQDSSNLDPSRTARAELDALAAELRGTLSPTSAVEQLLIDRLALAAWRLEQSTRLEARALIEGDGAASRAGLQAVGRESRRAERSLANALRLFERVRSAQRKPWGIAPAALPVESAAVAPIEAEDAPRPTRDRLPARESSAASPTRPAREADYESSTVEEPAGWEARLTVDPNVSQVSPVVRGTWVTAQQVVALIVDGWTWSDILRTHPELTEADIRACLAFTVDQDEFGGI